LGISHEVAIVGSGPHGLAAAAYLRSAGVEAHVLGPPMKFWQDNMPKGMFLRSSWDASHISDPYGALTLDKFGTASGIEIPRPIPLEAFVLYGRWFQRQIVPDLDTRRVARIEPSPAGFRLLFEEGESFEAQRVIVAAGIKPFAYRPPEFEGLPGSLVSHSCDHNDLRRFAGLNMVVIGAGQSALESAALLAEGGAEVELILRQPRVRWNVERLHKRVSLLRRLLYPPTDVGPPGLNQIVARPALFRLLPQGLQQRIAYRCIRPAASEWVRPRVGAVRITASRRVVSAAPAGDRLGLSLDDGTRRSIDHVLLATGYRVDISSYDFLAPELVRSINRVNGYPVLDICFESSVAGLHFLGAPAAWSLGPVMRFVAGSGYAARAVTQSVLRNRRHQNGSIPAMNGSSARAH
jgi:pyridine nucleotide-disulfide oxidoreductase